MDNYEKLKAAGMDTDALLRRLMGNASLVGLFVGKFLQDTNIQKLEAAFAARDAKEAEMASHTLKGMCGNLSLTELYSLFTRQVERLRAGEYDAAEAMLPQIQLTYGNAVSHMKAWLQGQ